MRRGHRLPLETLAPFLLELPESADPIDWLQVFGNVHPVELEIGFGKGLFLLTSAQARPNVNFVGVEVVRWYQLFAATRMAKRGQKNVRLACADARRFVIDRVAAGSLAAVHVYFPDPWWKQRHQKRRVFTAEFAAACARALGLGGRLHVASDVEEYFRMMTNVVAANTPLRAIAAPSPAEPAHDLDYLTNFERKFRKQSKPIYRAVWERT